MDTAEPCLRSLADRQGLCGGPAAPRPPVDLRPLEPFAERCRLVPRGLVERRRFSEKVTAATCAVGGWPAGDGVAPLTPPDGPRQWRMLDAPRTLDPGLRPQLEADLHHVHSMVHATDVDDRSLAIVGTAFLESILTEAIAVRLPVLDKAVRTTLFDPNNAAPLSSFAAKVHMARAMNAVAGVAYDDLKLIGRVRNGFAHNVRVSTFDHPKVRGYVDKLRKQEQVRSALDDLHSEQDGAALYERMFTLADTPRGRFACSISNLAGGLFNVTITDAGFGAACLQ